MRRSPLVVFLAVAGSPALAATYTVTSADNDGPGTLRQAIVDANANVGADTIAFAIPGNGLHTIAPTSGLPSITDALVIDGYTQPGAAPNTNLPTQGGLNGVLAIELSGANVPLSGSTGLETGHADTTIRGLVINGFRTAIGLGSSSAGAPDFDVKIEGCYLGTNAGGTAAVGADRRIGVDGSSQVQAHVVIGGADAAARNLISGFDGAESTGGVALHAALGGPIIRGNLIGTDASGMVAIANRIGVGIDQAGTAPTVPGALVKDNLVSGNGLGGLLVSCSTSCTDGLAISGNVIGTRRDGNAPLPNGSYGLRFVTSSASAAYFLVGGTAAADENVIAWNGSLGLTIANNGKGTIEIARNRIFANGGLDIDLPNPESGRNSNDAHDMDGSGFANRLQNFPVIVSASQAGNQLTLRYKVPTATAYATYPLTVRLYRKGAGTGGDRWLADDSYGAIDAELEKQVVLTLPSALGLPGLVATAADADGNSSEFSDPYVFSDLIFANDFER